MAEGEHRADQASEQRVGLADAEAEILRLRERISVLEARLAAAQRELMASRYERPPHWG